VNNLADNRFASIGTNVRIDPDARIFCPDYVSIGSNVRIDSGVILSASHPIIIGDYVHLAAGAKIFASGGEVLISDFAAISADAKIYSASDDYVSGSLTNPTVPEEFKDLQTGTVRLMPHAIVGAGSVILPGVTMGFGSAAGALSLIRSNVPEGVVVAGIPARKIAERNLDRLRELEAAFRATWAE
jgi:galactoside O-acetyltransferase